MMELLNDHQLLRRYAGERDEAAFTTLVERHLPRVHAVGVRQTRDRHLADDVAQATFILLARQASRIGEGVNLAGWLHQTACYCAANALRAERRRMRREASVATPQTSVREEPVDLELAAAVDRAVGELRQGDRDVIARRFFEGLSVAEIAAASAEPAETIKKRLTRALDKVRGRLARQGIGDVANLSAVLALPPPPIASSLSAGGVVAATHASGTAATELAAHVFSELKRTFVMKLATAFSGLALLVGGVAVAERTMRPDATTMTTAPATKPAAAPAMLTVAVPGNVQFTLVALRRNGDPAGEWFSPNGTPIAAADAAIFSSPGSLPNEPMWEWTVLARIASSADEDFGWTSMEILPFSTRGGMSGLSNGRRPMGLQTPTSLPSDRVERLYQFTVGGMPREKSCDMRFTITTGEWKRIRAIDNKSEDLREFDAKSFVSVQWSGTSERDGSAIVTLTHHEPNMRTKIRAIDLDGKPHETVGDGRRGTGSTDPGHQTFESIGVFKDLPLARVARFEAHARSAQPLTFYNVSLAAGETTSPRASRDDEQPSLASRTPIDLLDFPGVTLGDALDEVQTRAGLEIDVHWAAFTEYQHFTRESPLSVMLTRTTPPTAVRAILEAAGARDFTVAVSPDGQTIDVVPGAYRQTFGNFDAANPAKRNPLE